MYNRNSNPNRKKRTMKKKFEKKTLIKQIKQSRV